ncbi:MAG: hypothetical protein IJK91_09570 [Bacteroidales bacterium]|nr:hypothetical protein [Bacteroidales bacterium]
MRWRPLPSSAKVQPPPFGTTLGTIAVSDWAVAQKSDYEAIFKKLGSTMNGENGYTYDSNVNAYLTTGVGGSSLSYDTWAATEYNDPNHYRNQAWIFQGVNNPNLWWSEYKDKNQNVRPVLGF